MGMLPVALPAGKETGQIGGNAHTHVGDPQALTMYLAFKGSNNERGTNVQGSAGGLGTDWSRLAYTRTSGRSLLSACCSDLLNAPRIVRRSTHAHADEHPQDGHAHPTQARTHAGTHACTHQMHPNAQPPTCTHTHA